MPEWPLTGSLEYFARLSAPEEQIEGRHRNPNLVREPLGSCLNIQVTPRGQGLRQTPEDAVADQILQDMTVKNGQIFAAARIPKEMTCLFETQAVDFADEPAASILRGREGIQRLRELALAFREESLTRADDVRGFVVVEASAMTQECRDLLGFAGPQEVGLSESRDGRVGRAGPGLNGHDAEAELLKEPLVRQTSRAAELLQSGLDGRTFRFVLDQQLPDVPVARLQGRRKANCGMIRLACFPALPISEMGARRTFK